MPNAKLKNSNAINRLFDAFIFIVILFDSCSRLPVLQLRYILFLVYIPRASQVLARLVGSNGLVFYPSQRVRT